MNTTRLPVFDAHERTDATPARHEESTFAFLNRVAGDYWAHPRGLIEDWCSHLGDDAEYNDIRNRIRSRDNAQYDSAFLELYIHETLLRTGHTVTIHPTIPHTTRRPDFYAEKDGRGFYIEAIVPGPSKKETAALARRNRLIDVVNRLDDPNFVLYLRALDGDDSDPAPARLRSALRTWLKDLDPDSVDDLDTAPDLRWTHNGWKAEFVAIPLKPEARGKRRPDQRAIAIDGHDPVHWTNNDAIIVKALETKRRAYGQLDRPFLVAVGVTFHDTDRWDAMNAFYGHERVVITEADVAPTYRAGDGYFGRPGRWKNTQVSGVLLVDQLQPHHLHKTVATVWAHPGAEHPLPDLGWPGETMTLAGERLATTAAPVDALDLFSLPTPWPPGAPWAYRAGA